MRRWRSVSRVATVLTLLDASAIAAQGGTPPARSYLFFVASEASDLVTLVRFGSRGLQVEHRTPMNATPDEHVGPRGIVVVPGSGMYYVAVATGLPGGGLLKVSIATDSSPARSQPPDTVRTAEPLGAMSSSVQVTPNGAYAWVTSPGADGEATSPSITVVYLEQMVEVARIQSCATPEGGRLTADGSRHLSVCTKDDLLVEIDAHAMTISRRLKLTGTDGRPCAPRALALTPDGSRIYVACRASNAVAEVDANAWAVVRNIPAGAGPGAIALSHDGRTLVVAEEQGQAISLIDVASGNLLARVDTPVSAGLLALYLSVGTYGWRLAADLPRQAGTRLPVDVALSPDDRYAFIAINRPGQEPGTLAVIDLVTRKMITAIDLAPDLRAIAFWKTQ